MLYQESILSLVNANVADQYLRLKSPATYPVRSLQTLLYKLGFGVELDWEKYRADGGYGGGTTRAVKAYLAKNGLSGNGEVVDGQTAQLMLQHAQLLPHLRRLSQAVQQNQLAAYSLETAEESALQGLQLILNALGYGAQLRFSEFGAHGKYDQGTASALIAFATQQGISTDGTHLTADLGQKLVDAISSRLGPDWETANQEADNQRRQSELTIREEGNKILVHNEFVLGKFIKHKLGLYTGGTESPASFIETYTGALKSKGLTDSAIRVMIPVSTNEGNLDGINTWDNSFISFGMFQWTLGPGDAPGELAALLKKVEQQDPTAFAEYFGRYGLSVDANEINSLLLLNGAPFDSAAKKEPFRAADWAYRFWLAGLDPRVQIAEVVHAHSRLYSFYHHNSYKPLKQFFIDQLVTSEYGVALLLDHHVNRPGHLMNVKNTKDVVGEALQLAKLENKNPTSWTTRDEMKLLESYIPLRTKYKMTHGQDRADKILKRVKDGKLSQERGSFELQPQDQAPKTRGLGSASKVFSFPAGKSAADYPLVNYQEYEGKEPMPIGEK